MRFQFIIDQLLVNWIASTAYIIRSGSGAGHGGGDRRGFRGQEMFKKNRGVKNISEKMLLVLSALDVEEMR